jgi:outer membrane protein TolC
MSKFHFSKFYLLALLCLGGQWLQAQDEPQAFSLAEAVSYAQKNSITTQKTKLDIQDANAQVKEYQAIGIPKVNAKVDYQNFLQRPTSFLPDFISPAIVGVLEGFQLVPPGSAGSLPNSGGVTPVQFGVNNSLTASITASTLVFDGSYFVGLKAAKGLRDMTNRQADLSIYNIKHTITKAYLMALIAEENRKILLLNIENLRQLRAETEAFYKSGLVEQLDVDRLELNLQNLLTEAEIVNRQVELAYNVLKFQMNYDITKPIVLNDKLQLLLQEASEEDLAGEIKFDQRIEMDVLKQTEYLNGLNVKRLQMGYAPNLSAFITYQQQLQRNNLFDNDETGFTGAAIAGITLNVPIFDGFDKQAKIQRARIDQRRFQIEIDAFRRAVTLEVLNARAQYNNARQRLTNQEKNLALAQRILTRTKTKYKEGVGSSIEITTAEQELYRTQANYLNAMYDLVVAKADLDKALGK